MNLISLIGKRLNETILNILRNFIPYETVLCDGGDPPWFNNKTKSLIREKNITFKRFRSDRRNICLKRQLNCLQDADQCSLMSNASKLPSNFTLYTDNQLYTVTFSQDDIDKIIQNLNANKAHVHDNVRIRMLKICGLSAYGPL